MKNREKGVGGEEWEGKKYVVVEKDCRKLLYFVTCAFV